MTLRLVPPAHGRGDDEADGGGPFVLSPRQAVLVATYASILADGAYDDAEELGDRPISSYGHPGLQVLHMFPPCTWHENAQWRREAARAFDDLAADVDTGHSPTPRCTAEEMALHLVLERAGDMHRAGDVEHLIADTPPQPRDRDWNAPRQYLFQDHDVLALFDYPVPPMRNNFLSPEHWFTPFDDPVRDPHRGHRR